MYGGEYYKLNTYEATFRRLEETGFIEKNENAISNMGVALFQKEHLSVIVQNHDLGMEIKDIKEESIRIREKLHQLKINVWNSYYILCSDEEIVQNDLFIIERDSIGLRKYVIKQENDLNRIPFLDNQPVNIINEPIQISDNLIDEDDIIKNLYTFIEQEDGTEIIISNESIKKLIDLI